MKVSEAKPCNDGNIETYNRVKHSLEEIVEEIAEANRIRSRFQRYKKGEK